MPYTDTNPRLPFSRGSHTSYKAAVKQARNPQRGVKLIMLLQAFQKAGERGLTGAEAEDATGLLTQTVCSLRASLEEYGLIAKGGEREGRYGMKTGVWFYVGGK